MHNITLRLNPQLEKFLSYISINKSYTIMIRFDQVKKNGNQIENEFLNKY